MQIVASQFAGDQITWKVFGQEYVSETSVNEQSQGWFSTDWYLLPNKINDMCLILNIQQRDSVWHSLSVFTLENYGGRNLDFKWHFCLVTEPESVFKSVCWNCSSTSNCLHKCLMFTHLRIDQDCAIEIDNNTHMAATYTFHIYFAAVSSFHGWYLWTLK